MAEIRQQLHHRFDAEVTSLRLNLCRDALEQNEDLQRFARRTKEKLEA